MDAMPAQTHQAGIAQVISREARDKFDLLSKVRQRNGDIRLTAPIDCLKGPGLGQSLKARRSQAQHNLAERNDSFHR
jgi:hypothetical protein